jgi:glutaminyl-tRNA synthetase
LNGGQRTLEPELSNEEHAAPTNFIHKIIEEDLDAGKNEGRVHTRFPPEPNGYLHIGHAKSICLNFGLAEAFGGKCNLRFDDTNPVKEEEEFVNSIKEDVKWLGFDWEDREFFASDYFPQLYRWAIKLIEEGKAYVEDLSADEIREYRGTLSEPGKNSPHRDRPIEENLKLFKEMKEGKFPDGAKVLRAKIDMTSPNLNFRDPVLYRILHAEHHRTGGDWCIYPMYDWAHGQSDSIEGVTHSICTLEFEDHRPLYDWCLDTLGVFHPRQYEFARLNLTYTVLSKRKLLQLVTEKIVSGWDDPRMPTISGFRRRGFTASAIREFCERIGVAKANSTVDLALLEFCLREEMNYSAPRVMAVLKPLKIVLTNYPEDKVEDLEAENNPEQPEAGSRTMPFSRELYIEQEDFMEDPPKKFFRLAPGKEVRLKHAYIIKCEEVIKNDAGEITELHCTYIPETKTGEANAGKKVKGTLHWVSAKHAVTAEVRLVDNLFSEIEPDKIEIPGSLNPNSLEVLTDCKLEPSLKDAKAGERFQFLRMGYFIADQKDSQPGTPIFNRTTPLRDTWAKVQKKGN